MRNEIIDDRDRKILKLLVNNSRLSIRQLAKRLKLSPGTVQLRLKRLKDLGLIKGYTTLIDYSKLGYEFPVLIDVRVSRGRLFEVEREIAKHPNVVAVYDVTGNYDIAIIARFKRRKDLDNFVKNLQKIEYVERTNTRLILNIIVENKWGELI